MPPTTRQLWDLQNRHPGDRLHLFRAVAATFPARRALYPGSYVDLAASFVFPSVTYVDVDRRAAGFFADDAGVRSIIAGQAGAPPDPQIRFIHADYTTDLGLEDGSFDLLVSLYAGFVSEACTRYLTPGGILLANPSHGDAALAGLDPRYALVGAVQANGGRYRIATTQLDTYLVPRHPDLLDAELVRRSGRGVAYTRSAFAYLFRLRDRSGR